MRYGIISDVHANLAALEIVLKELEGMDMVIYLGDLVGYGPNPNECIERIRESCGIIIRGNHDLAAIGCKDLYWFNEYAREAIIWTSKVLSSEAKSYLGHLSEKKEFEDYIFVHGSLFDHTDEYILTGIEARRNLSMLEKGILFVGHTHVPSIFHEEGGRIKARRLRDGEKIPFCEERRLIVNVGSVGQPRDGDSRTSFGIIDTELKQIEIRRIPYDILKTQEMMRKFGLPRYLIERLSIGL